MDATPDTNSTAPIRLVESVGAGVGLRDQLRRHPRVLQQSLPRCCYERTVPLKEPRPLPFALLVPLAGTMASSCSSRAAGTAPTATVVGFSAPQQIPAKRITRDGVPRSTMTLDDWSDSIEVFVEFDPTQTLPGGG
jgi:hypothetical protein